MPHRTPWPAKRLFAEIETLIVFIVRLFAVAPQTSLSKRIVHYALGGEPACEKGSKSFCFYGDF
jgi:hypothetical protein